MIFKNLQFPRSLKRRSCKGGEWEKPMYVYASCDGSGLYPSNRIQKEGAQREQAASRPAE